MTEAANPRPSGSEQYRGRHDLIARLRAYEYDMRALGISGLFLFGSRARDTADVGSDIDLFCDYLHPFSMIELLKAKHLIEDDTGLKVDLSTRAGLHPVIKEEILEEAIKVF
jgi:hypothetical protein